MRQIEIHKLADDARFGRFHAGVLFWCALVIIFDGYVQTTRHGCAGATARAT